MGERLGAMLMVLLLSPAAGADEPKSFEAVLENAEAAGDLAERFDPLFADCKRDDDLDARQCLSGARPDARPAQDRHLRRPRR